MIDKSKFQDKREWRKFGIGVGVIFLLLGTLQFIFGKDLWPHFYSAGALFFAFSLLAPVVLKPVFIAFSYLGLVMGWFMTRVILTILFFAVITPIGLLTKLFNKKFLELGMSPSTKSYWMDKSKQNSKSNYEKQF
ncbi:hypothetical protein JW998_01750 [candidate division KSB1 bacterium]|nr:hypothetical protein [candidate division KSB1 bacterium]